MPGAHRLLYWSLGVMCCLGWRPGEAQTMSDRLERYMDHLVDDHDFYGTVLITKGDETLLSRAHGWANVEHGVPNKLETRFRIGSVTKQFTSMAILILNEQGKLNLADRITTHLDDLPGSWSGITIYQLLTHTSGIMHSWNLPDWQATMATPATIDETVDRFKDQPLVFEPGQGFQYSGVGYFILAQIIERVSGASYEAFLRRSIFEPIGMQDTGVDQLEAIIPNRASGYRRRGELTHNKHIHMPILTGGGNLYSTVLDLTRWDQALNEGKLISDASYKRMYTPERGDYAYGWKVNERFERREISHGGWVLGERAWLFRYPADRVCIAILTNVDHRRIHRKGKDELAWDMPAHPHSFEEEAHPWVGLAEITFGAPTE